MALLEGANLETHAAVGRLRSLLFNICFASVTALWAVPIPFLALFGSPSRAVRMMARNWARMVLALLHWIVDISYEVEGRENIPAEPCLIVCNHQSTWETIAFNVLFPNVTLVAKEELGKIPVFGWYLKRAPMILIDRDAGAAAIRKMAEASRKALAQGRSVVIFPQGTRADADDKVDFKRGVQLLYHVLDVKVLPVALNSGRFWPSGKGEKHAGKIRVSCLPVISPGLNAAHFLSQVQTSVELERQRLS
ncbi:lysophospholipid acyltransferase family protein [Methylovirgula sp. 4M-Z18]|uniref:lysophospholipid acyltransferase family protein n=1 Tax=Methylovirgula sp. 4M-Z18 TaxID=2293567 RepID=UPI000E2EDC3B|nr:lysophospholipid acyltransferase family protein [Methylovirgula sp. 4M-Z18]RFB81517.1 1-acyl-sn-glycerol-3-phosphate acyltransferase [Methylovirgula sp. 4M-Z18]